MKTLVAMWLITIALLIGACVATSSNEPIENSPFFDQVLAPEIVLIIGVYPEGIDKEKNREVLVYKNVISYLMFSNGDQVWITLFRPGTNVLRETVQIPYKKFTIAVEMRDKNRPRID